MGGFHPIIDPETGKITGYKTAVGGADTVFPFNSRITKTRLNRYYWIHTDNSGIQTFQVSAADLPDYMDLTLSNFGVEENGFGYAYTAGFVTNKTAWISDYDPTTGLITVSVQFGYINSSSWGTLFDIYVYRSATTKSLILEQDYAAPAGTGNTITQFVVDISSHSGYKNLTIDNFGVEVSGYGKGNTGANSSNMTAYINRYDPSTGSLYIDVLYGWINNTTWTTQFSVYMYT